MHLDLAAIPGEIFGVMNIVVVEVNKNSLWKGEPDFI